MRSEFFVVILGQHAGENPIKAMISSCCPAHWDTGVCWNSGLCKPGIWTLLTGFAFTNPSVWDPADWNKPGIVYLRPQEWTCGSVSHLSIQTLNQSSLFTFSWYKQISLQAVLSTGDFPHVENIRPRKPEILSTANLHFPRYLESLSQPSECVLSPMVSSRSS